MPTSTTNILLPYICGPPQLLFSSYLIFKRQDSQSLLVNKMTPIPYLYNTNNFLKSSIVFNSTIYFKPSPTLCPCTFSRSLLILPTVCHT